MILSEASTITGDPANGTVAYGYDPLSQLTGSTLLGTTTAYGWDTTTNRTSVQVGGGTPATTSYDAANRPTSGANPTATYTSDADGRLTARPNQTMTWDHLGRLTAVKDAAGTDLAATTYDPLDRLRVVDYGGGNRIRFRYVGLTTSAAQWLDDVAGTVTRSIGNGWTGERLLDWTGTGSNRRTYGTNAHHDVTWLADSTGAVSASLRYDPWGTPRSTPPSGYTPFRFQGYLVRRHHRSRPGWSQGGMPRASGGSSPRTPSWASPASPTRHLYAYAAGEPVGAWDPDGRRWFRDYDDHDQTFWAKTLTALCIGLSIFAVPVSAGTTAAAAAAFCLGQSFIALIAPRTNLVVRTFFNFVIHGGREPGLWVCGRRREFIRYWDERHQETRDAVDVWDPHPTEGRAFKIRTFRREVLEEVQEQAGAVGCGQTRRHSGVFDLPAVRLPHCHKHEEVDLATALGPYHDSRRLHFPVLAAILTASWRRWRSPVVVGLGRVPVSRAPKPVNSRPQRHSLRPHPCCRPETRCT